MRKSEKGVMRHIFEYIDKVKTDDYFSYTGAINGKNILQISCHK
jgi:hypothetical protein